MFVLLDTPEGYTVLSAVCFTAVIPTEIERFIEESGIEPIVIFHLNGRIYVVFPKGHYDDLRKLR